MEKSATEHQSPPPKAVLFDAYGTLFDVHSVALLAEQLFPGQGARLSVVWRDKQIEYTRLLTTSNHGAYYQPFWQVTQAALRYAIKLIAGQAIYTSASGDFDSKILTPAVQQLMNQYRHLSAFPENKDVLQSLQQQGIPAGILSNGDPAMLEVAVKSAGFDQLLQHVISVEPVRKFKTHPDAYGLGVQVMGVPAKDILFVSSNAWDALAATWYGYQTLWVNRAGLPFEELGTGRAQSTHPTQPTRTGGSLRDVLGFF